MKPKAFRRLIATLVLLLPFGLSPAQAQGTAFTYQGRLNHGANPANGNYDLRFRLFEDAVSPVTATDVVVTNSAVGVNNGLFLAQLDFGGAALPGADRWLEIGVRTNGGGA